MAVDLRVQPDKSRANPSPAPPLDAGIVGQVQVSGGALHEGNEVPKELIGIEDDLPHARSLVLEMYPIALGENVVSCTVDVVDLPYERPNPTPALLGQHCPLGAVGVSWAVELNMVVPVRRAQHVAVTHEI